MPVFHTKVIQSVLEPVAQQLSQLVILYEEAQANHVIPDITEPVKAVGAAVENLIKVGKQSLSTSKDEVMIKDMPPTFDTVHIACEQLVKAAEGFKENAESISSKSDLLNGSRGILNGTSQLLLVFDQSEVRKIVRSCENVKEYIKVAEQVESKEEVELFEKNLLPGLRTIIQQITNRADDLTNLSHATKLREEVAQCQNSVPLLVSAMTAFVNLKSTKPQSAMDAQENRNYIIYLFDNSLAEIIRVLYLTSPSEEMGALAEATSASMTSESYGGALPGTLAAKLFHARQLLAESENAKSDDVYKARYKATAAVLEHSKELAETFQPEDKSKILKLISEIESMNEELRKLEENGEGNSERAKELRKLIAEKLDELEAEMKRALAKQVVHTFNNPLGPLNKLTEAANAPPDAPEREPNYKQARDEFKEHAFDMSDTAIALAKSGTVTDKEHADELVRTAKKVSNLAPQVIHASKALFDNPENQTVKDHYTKMAEEYRRQVDKLVKLVDGGTDPVDFIRASETQLQHDLAKAKHYMETEANPKAASESVSSAARTATRTLAMTEVEMDNTEDLEYKAKLTEAKENVTKSIAPVVVAAKAAITQPNNKEAVKDFTEKGEKLVESVKSIGDAMEHQRRPPTPPPERPPPPQEAPPVPPPPEEEEPVPNDPIGFAAHQLIQDTKTWEEKENDMVAAAKRMAQLMMQMSKFARGEEGELHSKKDIIMTARRIVKESDEIVKMAKIVANSCTDKRLKRSVLQVIDKIPTIATQLKIIATVKATRSADDPESDKEATEMLTDNAQNLMKAVSEVLYATEAASIRVPPDSEAAKLGLRWIKRQR